MSLRKAIRRRASATLKINELGIRETMGSYLRAGGLKSRRMRVFAQGPWKSPGLAGGFTFIKNRSGYLLDSSMREVEEWP